MFSEHDCYVDEANMEVARTKAWDVHKNRKKVKGTHVQACEEFFRPPNKTPQRKLLLHLGQNWNPKIET